MSTVTIGQPTELLTHEIDTALKASPHLSRRNLQFAANRGRVRLEGEVSSYFQKQIAQEVILRLDGVEEIENLLEVTWA